MLLTVKHLRHEIGLDTIKTIQSEIAAIHEIPSPTSKTDLMRFIGSINFYLEDIDRHYVN